jgi:hypothetical protein
MNQMANRIRVRAAIVSTLLVFALVVGACGGGEEPAPATATPAAEAAADATTETTSDAAAAAAAAQDSPLAEPNSPLAQPESPLPAASDAAEQAAGQAAAAPQGPSIEIAVPSDFGVISQLAQETKAPAPKAGMATLSGVLYSPVINRVIPGTQFYLTPAIEENGQTYIPSVFVGPQVDLGDVAGITNENGQLILDSVPPGKYYLAVWTVYNWPLAFGSKDDALPLLITLEPGDQRDLGLLYVEWP